MSKPPKTLRWSCVHHLRSTMLSRFISQSSQFRRLLTLIPSQSHLFASTPTNRSPILSNPPLYFIPKISHFSYFSTRGGSGNSGNDSANSTTDLWKMSSEADQDGESVFSLDSGSLEGLDDRNGDLMKNEGEFMREVEGKDRNFGVDVFPGAKANEGDGGLEEWGASEDYGTWDFSAEGKEAVEDVFGVEGDIAGAGLNDLVGESGEEVGTEKSEQERQLEAEAKTLTEVLEGPDRAFGDLIAASGITDEMLDSLIALKDFEGIQGLPPLSKIEDI